MRIRGALLVVAVLLTLVGCALRQPPMVSEDFHDRLTALDGVDDAWVDRDVPIGLAEYYFAYVQLDAGVTPEQLDDVISTLADLPSFDYYHFTFTDSESTSMLWEFDSRPGRADEGSALAVWDARGHLPAGTRLDIQGDPGEAKYVHAWVDADGLDPATLRLQGRAFIDQVTSVAALTGYDVLLGDVYLSASAND